MKARLFKLSIFVFLIYGLLSCLKDEDKNPLDKKQCSDPPYRARFVTSPDYYFLPYFEITNTSRSVLENLELYYDDVINVNVYTLPLLQPGESYTISSPMPLPGDKIHVHLPDLDCINTYVCSY